MVRLKRNDIPTRGVEPIREDWLVVTLSLTNLFLLTKCTEKTEPELLGYLCPIYWVYHLMLIYLPRSFSYQFLQFPEMWTAERKAAAAGMGPTWILGSHLCLLKGQTPPVPTSVADEQPNCVPSGPSSNTIPAYDILLFKIIAKAQNSQFCSFNIAKKISFLVKTQYLAVWPGLEPRSSLYLVLGTMG